MWAAGAREHIMQQSHQEAARLPVSHLQAEPYLPTLGTSHPLKRTPQSKGTAVEPRAIGCSGCNWQTQESVAPDSLSLDFGISTKGPVPRCLSSERGLPHLSGLLQIESAPENQGDEQWKDCPRKHVPCQDMPLPLKSLLVPLTTSCLSVTPGCFSPWPPSAWPAPLAISAVHLASLSPLVPVPLATSVWQKSPPQP